MEEVFSKKQNYKEFLKFVFPSIVTMIFLSFYTTIDGFFVSRYVNSDALASINIVIPITCIVFGISVMLATGSGALVGIKLGERDKKGANQLFSFTTVVLIIIGIALTILGVIFLKPILMFLGTTEKLLPYAKPYGIVTILMTIPMMLKLYFEYYARVDGSPKVALLMSSLGLILNIVLDFLFIGIFKMGILGAGLGTYIAITVSGLVGLIYFISSKSNLKFTKPKADFKALLNSCYNGSSEMFTELSTGITTFLFNKSILAFSGENGIAAMSIIIYIYYFFIAVYFGVSVGISPMISYNFGAKNKEKIKESLKHSFLTIGWSSIVIFLISMFLGENIIGVFTQDKQVYGIATEGIKLFSYGFLLIGLNIFMSGYFTAIGNGQISAIISVLRSLIFVVATIIILPSLIGLDGIWLAIPISELLTVFFSVFFYMKKGRDILEHEENICKKRQTSLKNEY
ncbi:MATE family efflux transporter [Paeniclostridium sordellii]|uniref:Multidrug export protein MepA n=1 Tax=Paraclostridium sordellii TaxID=1505 RepID=A0A9P1KX19_PARSO|nr:MATE family efflux transporter [Paeniclostridium sordellii]MBS6024737.1 MATE family efflux transporter [Paeniclostridium sordellii]MCH1966883.1 MATE family efflux transporter [Paeniclostridium sordellii]MCR1849617.1 MATE family efflux transporter [Paeniclostridium sordellii]MDU2688669.1 MATE family efflux transporter [Paeniclostridium sordellii]MDU6481257.1 MATE family efflux transporter [Paeniclostridium sordellii]